MLDCHFGILLNHSFDGILSDFLYNRLHRLLGHLLNNGFSDLLDNGVLNNFLDDRFNGVLSNRLCDPNNNLFDDFFCGLFVGYYSCPVGADVSSCIALQLNFVPPLD